MFINDNKYINPISIKWINRKKPTVGHNFKVLDNVFNEGADIA